MSNDTLKIALIIGTTRPKRQTIHAARAIEAVAQEFDEIELTVVDPVTYEISVDGNDPENKIPEYTQIVEESDGFFIVTPEYNHGYPGSLKLLLDKELKAYIHKPVAFAGVSSGMIGGARAIEALVGAVREMGLVATFADVHFPKVQDMFDDDGELTDTKQPERIRRALQELVWMTRVLKAGRSRDA